MTLFLGGPPGAAPNPTASRAKAQQQVQQLLPAVAMAVQQQHQHRVGPPWTTAAAVAVAAGLGRPLPAAATAAAGLCHRLALGPMQLQVQLVLIPAVVQGPSQVPLAMQQQRGGCPRLQQQQQQQQQQLLLHLLQVQLWWKRWMLVACLGHSMSLHQSASDLTRTLQSALTQASSSSSSTWTLLLVRQLSSPAVPAGCQDIPMVTRVPLVTLVLLQLGLPAAP
jgi:hypothetical protein